MAKRPRMTDIAPLGRGFSRLGQQRIQSLYPGWEICSTPSSKFEARVRLLEGWLEATKEESRTPPASSPMVQTPAAEFDQRLFAPSPLAWSHDLRLMAVNKPHGQAFHEAGAIRGGWSVRPLDRRISRQFFERILPMA